MQTFSYAWYGTMLTNAVSFNDLKTIITQN